MRVDSQFVTPTLVDSPKPVEKKDDKANISSEREVVESQSFIPAPLSSSGIYSPSSLRAAVDYHAKFLTVAESNLAAANHAATIPRAVIDRLGRR